MKRLFCFIDSAVTLVACTALGVCITLGIIAIVTAIVSAVY